MNKLALEMAVREKGYKEKDFCEAVKIKKTAWYRKKNGVSDFTLSEITRIAGVIGMDRAKDIFFDQEVS